MNRNSIVTGVFVVLMCVAFVLPLVVAPEESDWFSAFPRQLVSWLATLLTVAILGYVARARGYSPYWRRVCEFVLVGVTAGFMLGTLLHFDSGRLPRWFLDIRFVPFSVKEFFANTELDTTYAPAFGMIVGMAIGLLYCYWRRRIIGSQNPSR